MKAQVIDAVRYVGTATIPLQTYVGESHNIAMTLALGDLDPSLGTDYLDVEDTEGGKKVELQVHAGGWLEAVLWAIAG
ncbi:MAG TPA: hypothetical protein VGS80_11710 [Ktedonobacterales bacterium]|nr:hypothetical protein [Ktedonobacterales bacterium]